MNRVINGLPIEIIRKNIKNMHLYVLAPNGSVRVTAPLFLGESAIIDFVNSKSDWIAAKQIEVQSHSAPEAPQFVDGETIMIFGESYTLAVRNGAKRNSLVINADTAFLSVKDGADAEAREKIVMNFYRKILTEKISEYMPEWEALTELYSTSWQIKNMKTRWGTCNIKTGKIWFNLHLAEKPEICLEYVILHELAHLKVPNHGSEFKAFVSKYMPDWREIKKLLNA